MVRRISSPRLVERVSEIESLEQTLARACQGQPRIELILGEAGIGKTRLVAQIEQRARERGSEGCSRCGAAPTANPSSPRGTTSAAPTTRTCRPPADGARPRMQMFEFLGPRPANPTRTSNHEALITFHEMGHYIKPPRGNATGLSNQQGRAMGEGWGDLFVFCMTSHAGDNFADGAFPVGGWTDLTPTFTDNYYFSIRRFPYSVDMAKNPLTLRHIGAGEPLPTGPPISPTAGGPNNAVHSAGEIWCTALWEVFVGLVAKHGHEEGEQRMLLCVVGGLELTPSRPTYLEARDGIVSAAIALHPEDLPEIWAGFAKRGMGATAAAPARNSTDLTGVVERFDVP